MEIIAIVLLIFIGIRIEIKIFSKWVIPSVIYECYFSKAEVMQGEKLEIIETVMNPSKVFLPCFKSELSTSNALAFAHNACTLDDKKRSLSSLFAIKSKQKITRKWKVDTLRRGAFKIEDITIIATDLLGAYSMSDIIYVNSEVVVLPRPIDVSDYIDDVRDKQGDRIVKRFILEDPFITASVREYSQSDSMNKIHWGLTARCGQLMVRNNEATSKRSIAIVLNMQMYKEQIPEEVNDEHLEYAIRIAAGEVEKTLKDSVPIRLLANASIDEENQSMISKQMWGQNHVHSLLIALARLHNCYTERFDRFIHREGANIDATEIILITCYLDKEMLEFAKEKQVQGIGVKIYVLCYKVDSKVDEDVEIYYLLDYLQEVGER